MADEAGIETGSGRGSALSAKMLETAINRYVRLDPDGMRAFRDLTGVLYGIEIAGIEARLYLRVLEDRIEVLDETTRAPEIRPDVIVSGTASALLRMLSNREGLPEAGTGAITITGEVSHAQGLKRALDDLEIDLEEQLSMLCGDVAAHQLHRMGSALASWVRQAAGTLLADASEYVLEEQRLAATRDELAEFSAQVDTLRDDTERLLKRQRRLERALRERRE